MEFQRARILVVDDEQFICELISRWLTAEGYECVTAANGDEALKRLSEQEFKLMVCDIMMPGMSGVDLLTLIKPLFPRVAVLMVTGVDDRKTAILTLELGAYGYVIKPFDRNEIVINVAGAIERRRLAELTQAYEKELEQKVRQRTKEVKDREEEIILRLLSATGFRDDETGAHVRRIGLYSELMAQELGWDDADVERIKLAAPMHDLGKIGIPDHILRKPGGLTPEEFAVMKTHAEIGAKILDGSNIGLLLMAKEIAFCHHERWDGSGYPRGLNEDDIPQGALICGVVDVYDALVHDRVYRPAFPEDEALTSMHVGGGEYYGPAVWECFLDILPQIREIRLRVTEDGASRPSSDTLLD